MQSLRSIEDNETRRMLEQARRRVSVSAHETWRCRKERDDLRGRLTELLAENPFLEEGDIARATTAWLFALFVLAVCILDLALFGPVSEEFGGREGAAFGWFLRIAVPLAIVAAEVTASIWRFLTRAQGVSSWAPTLVALIFAFVMPVLILATQLARLSAEGTSSNAIVGMVLAQMIGLVALSFGLHLVLLLSGRQLYEGKTYIAASYCRRGIERRIRVAERDLNRGYRDTAEAFVDYEDLRRRHTTSQQEALFDDRTVGVLHEIYRRNGNERPGYAAPADAAPHDLEPDAPVNGAEAAPSQTERANFEDEVRP